MIVNDDNYFRVLWQHNHRVTRELSGEAPKRNEGLRRLERLLLRTGLAPHGTKVVDLGCGDGTIGVFLSALGYSYIGVDIAEEAIELARERAEETGSDATFFVADGLDLSRFAACEFLLAVDAYCFHIFVLDRHRASYLQGVKRVLQDRGYLVLLGAHDEDAYEGQIESFRQFCEVTGADLSGVPAGRFVDGRWETVEDQRCYLLGRARSLEGYRREFAEAGFAVEHEETFGKPGNVAYVLRKASLQRPSSS